MFAFAFCVSGFAFPISVAGLMVYVLRLPFKFCFTYYDLLVYVPVLRPTFYVLRVTLCVLCCTFFVCGARYTLCVLRFTSGVFHFTFRFPVLRDRFGVLRFTFAFCVLRHVPRLR